MYVCVALYLTICIELDAKLHMFESFNYLSEYTYTISCATV